MKLSSRMICYITLFCFYNTFILSINEIFNGPRCFGHKFQKPLKNNLSNMNAAARRRKMFRDAIFRFKAHLEHSSLYKYKLHPKINYYFRLNIFAQFRDLGVKSYTVHPSLRSLTVRTRNLVIRRTGSTHV